MNPCQNCGYKNVTVDAPYCMYCGHALPDKSETKTEEGEDVRKEAERRYPKNNQNTSGHFVYDEEILKRERAAFIAGTKYLSTLPSTTENKEQINYFHTVCDKHDFVEVEFSVTNGMEPGIVTTKTIQCRFCGCLKSSEPSTIPVVDENKNRSEGWCAYCQRNQFKNKEDRCIICDYLIGNNPTEKSNAVLDYEKEERSLENKFVELIHDCKPFSETVEGCVKIAKEYASRQMSYPSDQWIKVTPETMPTTQVLLLTSSQVVIIGDWYKGEWRTHRSEWVPIEGSEFKRLKSAFKFEEIIAWMPLPKTPYEIEIDYNYPDECGNEWVEAKNPPLNLMAVLLLNVREGVFKFCEEGYWSEETRNYHTYHCIAENVTHWKLLPSLPRAIRPEQHSNPKVDAIRKAWKKSPYDSNSKVRELIEWMEKELIKTGQEKTIKSVILKANSLIQQDK